MVQQGSRAEKASSGRHPLTRVDIAVCAPSPSLRRSGAASPERTAVLSSGQFRLTLFSFPVEQDEKPREDQRIEEVQIHPRSGVVRGEIAVYHHLVDMPEPCTTGCYRAARGEADAIEPATIDVAGSDVIVIGTPVWMLRATPPANGAVEALAGCEGKTVVLFATCGGSAKDTLPHLAEALAAKGVATAAMVVLTTEDVEDAAKIDALIEAVKSAGGPA